MAHDFAEKGEQALDKEYPVLNHGFVRLVDYMGTDKRIVQSARVSYGEGTKTVREDAGLIDYLLRNDHWSPFEMVSFTFHLKMPIFVARQHMRHRTGKMNEISGRYSIMKEEFYHPGIRNIQPQATDNKQGRSGAFSEEEALKVQNQLMREQDYLYEGYEGYIDKGVAREVARMNLPLSLYTEMYWQMDLRNLMNYLRLRLDSHAQYEIRVYAEAIYEFTKMVCPLSMKSFENHILNGVKFSGKDMEVLKKHLSKDNINTEGMTERDAKRFLAKL